MKGRPAFIARTNERTKAPHKARPKVLTTIVTVAVLAACAPSDQYESSLSSRCKQVAVPACTNDPKDAVVRVQYIRGKDEFRFEPLSVCVEAGRTVEFELESLPRQLAGSAAVLPKNEKDTWLVGTNSADDEKIRVFVPEWVSDGSYDFNLIASNGSCIDPRFEVRH